MDTFKIAFDMVVVGALALPWVLLLLDLFLQPQRTDQVANRTEGEGLEGLSLALKFISDNGLAAVAGVLLFAMAYVLGAGISRLAGDFLNDDDFGILPATEDAIHYQVYCGATQEWLVDPIPLIKLNEDQQFNCSPGAPSQNQRDGDIQVRARRFFELQEAALLDQGNNVPARMSHIYQQVMILRGAVLDGVVLTLVSLMCFFGTQKRWGKWAVAGLSLVLLGWAIRALCNHLHTVTGNQGYQVDPPVLEASFILIVVLTATPLIWKGAPSHKYGIAFVLSCAMMLLAYAGWWWTEIVYGDLVLNLYVASHQGLQGKLP